MKYAQYLAVVVALAVILSLSAWAKESNKGTMQLDEVAHIGKTQLQPGIYKVEWSGNQPAVQVNIMQHDKIVATTSGKLQHDRDLTQDAVVLKPMNNGSQEKSHH